MKHLRYWLVLSVGARIVLAPVAVTLLFLIGIYAYDNDPVQQTWSLTALLCFPLTAWLTGATLRAEPDGQRVMRVAGTGAWPRAWRSQGWLGAAWAIVLVVLFLAYPLVTGYFDRDVSAGDLLDGLEAHGACALLGAAFGVLLGPPRVRRTAASLVGVVAALLLSIALAGTVGPVAGPQSVAEALSRAPDGVVTGRLQVAMACCLVLALGAMALARALEGRVAA